jgi:hypothetical protein
LNARKYHAALFKQMTDRFRNAFVRFAGHEIRLVIYHQGRPKDVELAQ